MKPCRSLRLLPLLVTASFLIGCGDWGSDPPTAPSVESGSVSFASTGSVAGSFSVSGAVQLSTSLRAQFGTWAVGGRQGSDLSVSALQGRSSPRGDFFVVFLENTTAARTATISELCTSNCAEVVYVTNTAFPLDLRTFDRSCRLTSGSVTVTSISAEQVQGTFSGQGICITPTGVQEEFAITSGTFDVPVVLDFDPV